MTPTITAFSCSPDRGKGLGRDMRVRWALEEVGQPYDVRLLSFGDMKQQEHLALHPFGQIPTFEEGDLALFESGAIVLHLAEHHAGLLPDDANARMRAITWMFAALNTMEPPIVERSMAGILERKETWYAQRAAVLDERVRQRLGELSRRIGDADWLDGAFSAGDLLMVTVLLRLQGSGMVEEYPTPSSPAEKRGAPTSVPSKLNWPCSSRPGRPGNRRRRGSPRAAQSGFGLTGWSAVNHGWDSPISSRTRQPPPPHEPTSSDMGLE